MSPSNELDIGPLSWVKNEINLALEQASQHLGDTQTLKKAAACFHQARGALSIVGLAGVTEFAEALEQLLSAVQQGSVAWNERSEKAVREGIEALQLYLDTLMAGSPNQPLRLLEPYRQLILAQDLPNPSPSDLFFPDLTVRPPKREMQQVRSSPQLEARRKAARLGFERGVKRWAENDPRGLRHMRNSMRIIEQGLESPVSRTFWWIAIALFDAIGEGAASSDERIPHLLGRIEAQIRKLLDGSATVADRLLRDVLYVIATSGKESDQLTQVRGAYRLEHLLPEVRPNADVIHRRQARFQSIREEIAATEEDWDRFCGGQAAALVPFHERADRMAEIAAGLDDADLHRLTAAIAAVAGRFRRNPLDHHTGYDLEVATALLLVESIVDSPLLAATDGSRAFAHQVDIVVQRLNALQDGQPLDGIESPQLEALTRNAQEKRLMVQVGKEIQSNLAQVEQALDAFFRNPEARDVLTGVHTPLHQVVGALTIMGETDAANLVQDAQLTVSQFANADQVPSQEACAELARRLSALGFYIEQRKHGAASLEALLDTSKTERVPETTTATVEDELLERAQMTRSMVRALNETPEDESLRAELKQNLEALREDAHLTAETRIEAQVTAALEAIDAQQPAADIGAAVAALTPTAPAPEAPSAETAMLAASSEETIDAEMLSIFLEEAQEVMATLEVELPRLRTEPGNKDVLATVRRSFHTLKGSSRMVGLNEFGEAGWAVEQVLNRSIKLDHPPEPAILAMLGDASALFSAWVRQLLDGGSTHYDASPLIATCNELLGLEAPAASALPATSVPPTATEASAPAAPAEFASDFSFGQEVDAPISEGLTTADAPAETAALEMADLVPSFDQNAAPPAPMAAPDIGDLDFSTHDDHLGMDALATTEVFAPVIDLDADVPALDDAAFDFSSFEAIELPAAAPPALLESAPEPARESEPEPFAAFTPAAEPVPEPMPEPGPEPESAPEPMINAVESAPEPVPAAPTVVQIGERSLPAALHQLYVDEAYSHLAALDREQFLLALQPPRPEIIRAAHTLGSTSATTGMDAPQVLAQALERVLNRFAASGVNFPADQVASVEVAIAALRTMIDAIARCEAPTARGDLTDALLALEPTHPVDAVPAAPVAAPEAVLPVLQDDLDEQLLPIFLEEATTLTTEIADEFRQWRRDGQVDTQALKRLLHTLKGSARMAGAMNVGEQVHDLEARVIAAPQPTQAPTLDELESAYDRIALGIDALANPEAAATEAPEQVAAEHETATTLTTGLDLVEAESGLRAQLRVRADLVDRLVNEAGEMAISRSRIEGELRNLKLSLGDLTENVARMRTQLRELEIQAESQIESRRAEAEARHAEFDPLEMDRFTRFQELTRMMAESVNDVATVQNTLLRNLDAANLAASAQARINRDISQNLMNVRMTPFQSVADRLYRVVRQTAKELDRRANLDIRGGTTEMDRSVLEAMVAPIEHLLRNALAHGLEGRAERLAAHKTEQGEITLSVGLDGNEVLLEIADDGAGLNIERIRSESIRRGLLNADEFHDDRTVAQAIFQTGFSTASEVTAIAGRGVGLDVVRSEVAALGGRIEVDWQPGLGTTFRIHLPVTLTLTQAVLVRCNERIYAIPSSIVAQASELKPEVIERIRQEGHGEWQGASHAWHYLPRLLGTPEAQPIPQRRHWLIYLKGGADRIAVEVDDLIGGQEIVVKNIGPQLARVPGIAGATVLSDGQIVLILNPTALAQRAPQRTPHGTATAAPVAAVARALPRVLVVDDSLTVRKITSRLLERSGYEVETAKDGVDALEKLLDVLPDVILADIEMPRMDGFDLVRNIRSDERLKHLPVIMITSRTAEKHQAYAREIGVNHYLGKPYDEDELLRLIAGFVHH